jgi:hypothetical protein
MFAAQATTIPRPDDLLWIDEDVYNWRCLDEFAVSSYWTGDYAATAETCRELLEGGRLPAQQQARVRENLDHALAQLHPQSEATDTSMIPRQIPGDLPAPVPADPTSGVVREPTDLWGARHQRN